MRLSAPGFCMRRKLRNFVSLPLPRITFNLVPGDSINVQRSNVPALLILRWDGGEQGRPAIDAHQCSNTRKCSFNATGKGLSGVIRTLWPKSPTERSKTHALRNAAQWNFVQWRKLKSNHIPDIRSKPLFFENCCFEGWCIVYSLSCILSVNLW